jgi:hypothetical protein
MYIAHRSFLVQILKMAICIQDVGLLRYILLVGELVKEAALRNEHRTF